MASNARLAKEWREIKKAKSFQNSDQSNSLNETDEKPSTTNENDSIILYPINENNLYQWEASISGPKDTPYYGGTFKLKITIPQSYPHTPPQVVMITKIAHPNIKFHTGEICLDILKDAWTPIWTIEAVCRAVQTLLEKYDETSPLNCDCANIIRAGDLKGYYSLARMYTIDHAMK